MMCHFESEKCEKEGKQLQKLEYLETENFFLINKNILLLFEGLSFGEKIKM